MSLSHRELLRSLVSCSPGKGLVIPNPSPEVLSSFHPYFSFGWLEELSSGPIRIWKITPHGRIALHQVPDC